MNRHNFAPAVVPEDAQTFLDADNPYFDQQRFESFARFYELYGQNTAQDSPAADVPFIEACVMTRTFKRSALILRSSNDDYDTRRYKLFKHDYDSGQMTEFAITKTQFVADDGDFNPETKYVMLYLAESAAGQGVLEMGSTRVHQSVWTFQGQEFLLDPIPDLGNI